ncbi:MULTISPECIES: DUF4170 domain-containing protein [Nisaea]|jgi:hypothetical protein|uniref:DUF4170 domain-containing protein n=1 Tax=Nisaea TaxID=390876 RepID=UPI000416DAAF|nr:MULTISPECIES: hypothetical protein [Nisaea]
MSNRFWVIGGEYTDTRFSQLIDGTEKMFGPFGDQSEARQVWDRIASETRSICTARFTIVQEGASG